MWYLNLIFVIHLISLVSESIIHSHIILSISHLIWHVWFHVLAEDEYKTRLNKRGRHVTALAMAVVKAFAKYFASMSLTTTEQLVDHGFPLTCENPIIRLFFKVHNPLSRYYFPRYNILRDTMKDDFTIGHRDGLIKNFLKMIGDCAQHQPNNIKSQAQPTNDHVNRRRKRTSKARASSSSSGKNTILLLYHIIPNDPITDFDDVF